MNRHLISFIHYQFHLWQDAYVTILLSVVNSYTKKAKKAVETIKEEQQNGESKEVKPVQEEESIEEAKPSRNYEKSLWLKTFEIIESPMFSYEEKLDHINELAVEYREKVVNAELENEPVEDQQVPKEEQKSHFDFLSDYYQKLHNRVSDINLNSMISYL